MSAYWVKLSDGRRGCVVLNVSEMMEDDQLLNAETYVEKELGVAVVTMQTLPYAATPLLLGSDMTFCFTPLECVGRTSCPRRRSCCD